MCALVCFFFQAEDGIRDLVRSRGLGDVYKRQPESLDALGRFANRIGLLFQVVDDILDAEASTATLGKTAGKDAANNKPTYVNILGLNQAKAMAASLRQDAHEALASFGDSALRLHELTDFIVERTF